MYNKIQFNNINRIDNKISFNIIDSTDGETFEESIFFEFNVSNTPSDTTLALAFAGMLRGYDEVYIDLPLSSNTLKFLRKGLNAKVECKQIYENEIISDKNNLSIILSFSGGIDSLATMYLFPQHYLHIVSVDFGKEWERETKFFSQFNPYILKTNFRSAKFFKKIAHQSPPFMSIGSMLFKEKIGSIFFSTGDVLEVEKNFNCNVQRELFPSGLLNWTFICPTMGLTEIATAKIVLEANKDNKQLIDLCIKSLANIGTNKLLRKELILNVLGFDTELHMPIKKLNFGDDYVTDFLYLYIYKAGGPSLADKMLLNVPDEIIKFINKSNLTFYNKFNPKALITMQNTYIANIIITNLFKFGIDMYSYNDFRELAEARSLFAKIYKENNMHINLTSQVPPVKPGVPD